MSLRKILREGLSGNRAKSYVERIAQFHRIQASPMYREAAEYIRDQLLKAGFQDAHIEHFRSDGATCYGTYTSPPGWEVTCASLALAEPERRLLVDYADTPTGLHAFSAATPPEGITAELVDVGPGTRKEHYEGKEIRGKFVLATGRARSVHEEAVFTRGALGVITDAITFEMPGVRESIDIPDAHAYQAIWPTSEELPKVCCGFSISRRQGNELRAMLASKKSVRLHASVEARFLEGSLDVVTATIPGTGRAEGEVFLVAHLCHPRPSANDNASGTGLLLEIAGTLSSLIGSGKLDAPVRTMRFLWVPETYGTIAYLQSHPEALSRMRAGINLDMVGQDQEECRSTLNLDSTPDSLPSFLNDFVFECVQDSVAEFDRRVGFSSSSTFRYCMGPFSGGSDHSEFDDSAAGIPCVMLLQWPDLFYHTSMDTTDKVSPDSLARVGWISALAILRLANMEEVEAMRIVTLTNSEGLKRMVDAGQKACAAIIDAAGDKGPAGGSGGKADELLNLASYHMTRIDHVTWREKMAIRSITRFVSDARVDSLIEKYGGELEAQGKREKERVEATLDFVGVRRDCPIQKEDTGETESRRLVPSRTFKWTLNGEYLKSRVGEDEYEWLREMDEKDSDFGKKCMEAVNFMDGTRTIAEIADAVSSEYAPTPASDILRFVRLLEKAGLVTIHKT